MTAEQLQSARADAWRQSGNPLLTADDAASWLRETGLCLFLPRGAQIAAPAPSFVEATLGAANATPAPAAIEAANELLLRLLAQGDAVALNLLGGLGSQPDFLATPETLPFIYALRGDKEWKRGPRGKSSPLVTEVWKLLDKEGSLNAAEVKDLLGRELTEAAALRALTELWNTLRIEPVYREYSSLEDQARWQPLDRDHAPQLQAGSTMSAGMAISALVSLYLQSSIAATEEEIEAFLSPLCSRSKVRDAVRGLSATRQLASVHLGGAELYHVEGSLPEFPEVEIVASPRPADIEVLAAAEEPSVDVAVPENTTAGILPRKRSGGLVRRSFAFRGEGKNDEGGERKPFAGARRPAGAGRMAGKPAQRTMGSARPGSASRRPSTPGGTRKPYGTRSAPGTNPGINPDRKPFHASEPWIEDRKPRPAAGSRPSARPAARAGEGSSPERKPYPSRSAGAGERKPFGGRKTFGAGADRKPFTPRGDSRSGERGSDRSSERKAFSPGQNRPFPPRSGAGAKPSFGGARKSFSPREGASGERKPWVKREGGSTRPDYGRKPVSDRKPAFGGERGSREDRPYKPQGDRPKSSSDKPFTPRRDSGKPPFGAARKPFDRNGGPGSERRAGGGSAGSYRGGSGDRKPAFGGAGAERSFKPPGDRPAPNGDRPYTPRNGATSRPAGDRKPAFGGPRKPFAAGGGEGGFKPRSNSRPDSRSGGGSYGRMGGSSAGSRPAPRPAPRSDGPDRPSSPRPPRPATDRPRPSGPGKGPGGKARTSGFTSSGKPRSGVKPTGRPGPRATRPPGAPGKPKSARRKPDGE